MQQYLGWQNFVNYADLPQISDLSKLHLLPSVEYTLILRAARVYITAVKKLESRDCKVRRYLSEEAHAPFFLTSSMWVAKQRLSQCI